MIATETQEKHPIGTLVLCRYGYATIKFRIISGPNSSGSYAAVAVRGTNYEGMTVLLSRNDMENSCVLPNPPEEVGKNKWWKFW